MEVNIDNLRRLIENIKTIGFWSRLFSWAKMKNQLVDASADIQKLLTNNEYLSTRNSTVEQSNSDLTKDLKISNDDLIRKQGEIDKLNLLGQENTGKIYTLTSNLSSATTTIGNQQIRINELTSDNRLFAEKNDQLTRDNTKLSENEAAYSQTISDLTNRKGELDLDLANIKKDLERIQDEFSKVKEINTQLLANEDRRKQEHSQQTATLKNIQDTIQAARDKEIRDEHDAEIERLNNLKLTWTNHQENVRQAIKSLCGKHTIEYVEKVSFKGEPDNTLKICDEFIVFDAKSPRGEDLDNFPNYIKEQSEKAKKYANEENVKKWIFFVVPSNTFEVIKTFVYPLADYDVFVVTLNSLEPILLSLKKVEEYEFADKLSPEARESICRVLGKFAHLSKRRIQIDTYFINQFMELAYKCESDLPSDFLERASEFERAEKLNPPQEKRVKAISLSELEKSAQKARIDATTKGILIEDAKIAIGLNNLPLYKPETD
jgi:cell division protein FtsB